MGIRVAEGFVEISADTDRLDRDLDGIGGRSSGGLMSSGLKLGGALVGGLLAVDLAGKAKDWIGGAIMAGSDLNETISKSTAIFGPQQAAIASWASTSATSIGLSTAAAMSAASGFGDMFTQIGFTGDEAAKMSTSVVQAAADLGSFSNLETADVSDRIAAAFRGEYDSLQAVIPNINAARVESEAMAATGKTTASALTAQEKATAVMAIVTKDGERAMGDFGRTSGGFANQLKIAAAQSEDLKGKLGTALQPALQAGAGVITGTFMPALLGMADRAGPAIESVISGIGGLKSVLVDGDFTGSSNLFGFTEDSGFVDFLFRARDAASSAFGFIGSVIGTFGAGVGPWLEPLVSLGGELLPVILRLGQDLSPVALILQTIAPVAGMVGSALGQFAVTIGGTLVGALTALEPAIGGLTSSLSLGIAAVLPMIVGMLPTVASLFGSVASVAVMLVSALAPLVSQLVAALLPALVQIVGAVLPVVSSLVGLIGTAIVPLVSVLLSVLMPTISALLPVVTTVFGVIASVVSAAMQIVQGVIQVVTGIITGNWSMVWSGILNIASGAWNSIKAVVMGAISIIGSLLSAGGAMISNTWSGIWNGVRAFFSGAISGIVGMASGLVSSVSSKVGEAISFFTGIQSKVLGALAGAGSWLVSVGRNIIDGLLSGVQAAAGRIKDAVLGPIKDSVDAVKNFLGIHSPSRLFHDEIGVMMGRGLTGGWVSQVPAMTSGIVSSVSSLVSAAASAASGMSSAVVGSSTPIVVNAPSSPTPSGGGERTVIINQTITPAEDTTIAARKLAREIARNL